MIVSITDARRTYKKAVYTGFTNAKISLNSLRIFMSCFHSLGHKVAFNTQRLYIYSAYILDRNDINILVKHPHEEKEN